MNFKKKYKVMKLLFPILLLFVPHRFVFLWFCFHCSANKFPFNQLPGVDWKFFLELKSSKKPTLWYLSGPNGSQRNVAISWGSC